MSDIKIPIINIPEGVLVVGAARTLSSPIWDEANTPIDMTGWSIMYEQRKFISEGGAIVLRLVSGAGITLATSAKAASLGIVNDVVLATIPAALSYNSGTDLVLIDPGKYLHAWRRLDDDALLAEGWVYWTEAGSRGS